MQNKLKKDSDFQGNQFQVDPRQAIFLSNYLDPQSETFSNGLQSALKAGYSQTYALNLFNSMPEWLSESIEDANLVQQATRNLQEFIHPSYEDKRIKADMTKFVLERLNKRKYSQKTEQDHNVTGKIEINITNYGDNPSSQV